MDRTLAFLAYTPHSSISISSDADFAAKAASEGWPGDGSSGNPYIISGYDIDGMGYRNAIFIGNTSVHFQILDSYLHNSVQCGIYLYGVSNGTISRCYSMYNSPYGICLRNCVRVNMTDGGCDNNQIGMFLRGSSNCSVLNSHFDYNSISGIIAHGPLYPGYSPDSAGNLVSNNSCTDNNDAGIQLVVANNCSVIGNRCSFDAGGGISAYECSDCVFYGNNCTGGMYGIEAVSCERIAVDSNSCSNNAWYGIYYGSSGSSGPDFGLTDNTCTGNSNGIVVRGDGITIARNTCTFNTMSGILVNGQVQLTISSNNLSDNGQYGVSLVRSNEMTLTDNDCENCGLAGILIRESLHSTLRSNVLVGCGLLLDGSNLPDWGLQDMDGSNLVNGKPLLYAADLVGGTLASGKGQIILVNCRNMVVEAQALNDGTVGISLAFCTNITASYNNCSDNSWAGVYLAHSENNNITGNSCDHAMRGLYLNWSDANQVVGNICEYSTGHGILLNMSLRNTVLGNGCSVNGGDGIHVESPWDTDASDVLIDNMCFGNAQNGIEINRSSSCTIAGNNCSHNARFGLEVFFSIGLSVQNNSFSYNDKGVYLLGADGSGFRSNIVEFNSKEGIYMLASDSNAFTGNWIEGNALYGVRMGLMPAGMHPVKCDDNSLVGNAFINNNGAGAVYNPAHIQALLQYDPADPPANEWDNGSSGNFWSDWQTPDSNGDGIVDSPYMINAIAQDNYPLTNAPLEPEIFEFRVVLAVVPLMVILAALIGSGKRRVPR